MLYQEEKDAPVNVSGKDQDVGSVDRILIMNLTVLDNVGKLITLLKNMVVIVKQVVILVLLIIRMLFMIQWKNAMLLVQLPTQYLNINARVDVV